MVEYRQGIPRDQLLLYAQYLDELVEEDNIVRIIDAYVDMLNMYELGFKMNENATGATAYRPQLKLKIYVYGYLNGIRSRRRLTRKTAGRLFPQGRKGRNHRRAKAEKGKKSQRLRMRMTSFAMMNSGTCVNTSRRSFHTVCLQVVVDSTYQHTDTILYGHIEKPTFGMGIPQRKSLHYRGAHMTFACNPVRTPALFLLLFSTLLTAVHARGQISTKHDLSEQGLASYYAGKFQGRLTANGEIFDTNRFTAAHKTLPFHTIVQVTNEVSGHSVLVRINDRGPFVAGRIIDLSRVAAGAISMVGMGLASVRLEVIELGDGRTYHNAGPPSDTVSVQVGAFGEEGNAMEAIRLLESNRLEPVLETNGSGLTRVILPEVHTHELELIRLMMVDLGFTDVLVRR